MNVMVPIPDDFAARFGSQTELGRRVVEALALEEYRAGRLTRPELREVLRFATPGELDGFLRERGLVESVVPGSGNPTGDKRKAADELVERFQRFRTGKTLGGLDVNELILEGRR